jgi:Heavy metal associated domain 2/ABC 3 transport family
MSSILQLKPRRSSIVKREAMRRPHEHVSEPQDSQCGLRLRSAVPGRMRWEAEALRDHDRKAAKVERTLQQIAGIISAQVTPLTGRLLVRYDAGLSADEIAAMVHAALQAPRPTHEAHEILPNAMPSQRPGKPSLGGVHVDHQGDHLAAAEVPVWDHWSRPLRAYITLTHRVSWRLQGLVFVLLLAMAVTQSVLAAGAALVLSLIVTPAATAGLLTARFTPLLVYWMGFAAWSAWLGLWLAAQSIWLPTVFIAMSSLALHLGVRCLVVKMGGVPRLLAYGQHRRSHLQR